MSVSMGLGSTGDNGTVQVARAVHRSEPLHSLPVYILTPLRTLPESSRQTDQIGFNVPRGRSRNYMYLVQALAVT